MAKGRGSGGKSNAPLAAAAPRCPNHGVEACCTGCTNATDGRGFPHFREAKGRRVLQRCTHNGAACLGWTGPADWVHDIDGVYFGCVGCSP